MLENTTKIDGLPCVLRAGRPYMTDDVAARYLGKTPAGYVSWVNRHHLTRLTHGMHRITPKEEIDRASGALEPLVV